ncbi:four-carbon acid sugar kinase family protein [Acidovorax sp. A1169]|nr:four-carbon acid sugar kinase family protein [Acidovorax sp. A1169]MDP4075830.1 four-carbon acid sugar kinase family protein [Acidovorax sp. A1169]
MAGAARAMAPETMRVELQPVGRFFAQMRVPVLHYKVCSTFDSAPQVGGIGVAVHTLRQHVENGFVPIVGGQPSLGRYCVFGNLFARAGSAPSVHRIDRHPTMSRHPVTPMQESDLRCTWRSRPCNRYLASTTCCTPSRWPTRRRRLMPC